MRPDNFSNTSSPEPLEPKRKALFLGMQNYAKKQKTDANKRKICLKMKAKRKKTCNIV